MQCRRRFRSCFVKDITVTPAERRLSPHERVDDAERHDAGPQLTTSAFASSFLTEPPRRIEFVAVPRHARVGMTFFAGHDASLYARLTRRQAKRLRISMIFGASLHRVPRVYELIYGHELLA